MRHLQEAITRDGGCGGNSPCPDETADAMRRFYTRSKYSEYNQSRERDKSNLPYKIIIPQ
jgi:hypothetical protein